MCQLKVKRKRAVEHLHRIKLERESKQLKGTFMCGRWHTRGHCFSDCKNKASHVPCLEIPAKVKQAHMQWMKKVHHEE
jgi:hypothetical protein